MKKSVVQLNQASIGKKLTVIKVSAKHTNEMNRLKQLNIRPGSHLRVLQLNELEPLVVAVGDARIAVNYDLAKSILVRAES